MASRRSRSPLNPLPVRLTLPMARFVKKPGFPVGHFYNFRGSYSTSTVKIGESLSSLFMVPMGVSQNEWLAYHLHVLIDRTCALVDYMQFICRDGVTLIDYDSPIDYAIPIDLTRFDEAEKQRYHQPYALCTNIIRVGADTYVPTQHLITSLANDDENTPFLYIPLRNISTDAPFEPGPGATTYIKNTLNYMKILRMDTSYFPRKKTEEIKSRRFRRAAQFIMYHLTNIMTHFICCHTDQIEKGGIANQVFSLFLSIFVLGDRFSVLPPRSCIDNEVHDFYRHLKSVDHTVYENVPDIKDIFREVGENRITLATAPPPAGGEPQGSSTAQQS